MIAGMVKRLTRGAVCRFWGLDEYKGERKRKFASQRCTLISTLLCAVVAFVLNGPAHEPKWARSG